MQGAEILASMESDVESVCEEFRARVEGAALVIQESGFVSGLVAAVLQWVREFVAKVRAIVARAVAAIRSTFAPREKQLEAMPAAVGGFHESRAPTAGQVLRTPGWVMIGSPSLAIYRSPGAGMGDRAVTDALTAFGKFFAALNHNGNNAIVLQRAFDASMEEIYNRPAQRGGPGADRVVREGSKVWYTGDRVTVRVEADQFVAADKLCAVIGADSENMSRQHPEVAVARIVDALRRASHMISSPAEIEGMLQHLKAAGTAVTRFYGGAAVGAATSLQSFHDYKIRCLTAVAGLPMLDEVEQPSPELKL